MFMITIAIYVYFNLNVLNFFFLQQGRVPRRRTHCNKDDLWSGIFQFFVWLSLSMAMLCCVSYLFSFFSLFFYCFPLFLFIFIYLFIFYSYKILLFFNYQHMMFHLIPCYIVDQHIMITYHDSIGVGNGRERYVYS